MSFTGSNINFFIAVLAGVFTFFASCLIPLVPTYVAYLSGFSRDGISHKRELFINSFIFVFGFISTFILFGLTATSLGFILRSHRAFLQQVGGFFLIFVGLFMLGLFKTNFLMKERRINLHHQVVKNRKIKSFLFGVTFGFAWSPCIGPILSVILFWASQAKTMLRGIFLLFSYGVGLGIPFVLIALFIDKFQGRFKISEKLSKALSTAAALLILITGILLVLGKLNYYTIAITRLMGIPSHGL